MKVIVSKIPEGGMDLRFGKDEAWFRERLTASQTEAFVVRNIEANCTVRRMKETVFLAGTVAAQVDMPCCRCLERTVLSVSAPFRYTFAPPPAESREELELSAEDLDYAYYEGDAIELDDILFEQILLQIPIKPLCGESCKGLCPRCGSNLNRVDCQCRNETIDERLAVLKTLKLQS